MAFSALAAIGIAGATAGAVVQSNAARSAARTQQQSAAQANQTQRDSLSQARADLELYRNLGGGATAQLSNLLGIGADPARSVLGQGPTSYAQGSDMFSRPFMPTQEQLESTPGYQFALTQGLRGVTNQTSARGLAGSGAQAKALGDYATGLASQTYQQQLANHLGQQEMSFNQGVTNQTNLYNRLLGLGQMGQNSAAMSGSASLQTGSNIAANTIGAGNAAASGTVGSANAIAQGLGGVTDSISQGVVLNRLMANPTSPFANPLGRG